MRLTRSQRSQLFEGDCPKITYPGATPCPVEVGHVEVLSAHVRLEITGVRRTKKGEWSLVYTLHNNRIGQRFLAVQDGQLHPQQYAHSGGSAVDPECGEAVDEFTQRKITRDSRDRTRRELEEMVAAMEQVRSALDEQVKARPDLARAVSKELWQIRGRIDAAKTKLKRRMAA